MNTLNKILLILDLLIVSGVGYLYFNVHPDQGAVAPVSISKKDNKPMPQNSLFPILDFKQTAFLIPQKEDMLYPSGMESVCDKYFYKLVNAATPSDGTPWAVDASFCMSSDAAAPTIPSAFCKLMAAQRAEDLDAIMQAYLPADQEKLKKTLVKPELKARYLSMTKDIEKYLIYTVYAYAAGYVAFAAKNDGAPIPFYLELKEGKYYFGAPTISDGFPLVLADYLEDGNIKNIMSDIYFSGDINAFPCNKIK